MSDILPSPPPRHHYPSLDGSLFSVRNQHLPGLIKSRSSASLSGLEQRNFRRVSTDYGGDEHGRLYPAGDNDGDLFGAFNTGRRASLGWEALNTPQMRSVRLIGNSNPRYQWHKYYKPVESLQGLQKPIRKYHERNNYLIAQYLYIDRLLDSSLPHNLIQEYNSLPRIPSTITEEPSTPANSTPTSSYHASTDENGTASRAGRVKRTPKTLFKVPDEESPLIADEEGPYSEIIALPNDETVDTSSPIVSLAIKVNFAANAFLLAGKIAVIVLTSSLSVLASLVDAALDFLSTVIVALTTWMILNSNRYQYPIGRARLEPVGVLVFSVVMITAFAQVALQCISRLSSADRYIVQLGIPSISIMIGTIVVKGACWFWCRLVKNSSVQALAQDAMTDVIFNIFSIIFPIVGYYAQQWWMDALGGLLLSLYIMFNWSLTSAGHIRNLTGAAASYDERNVLLYLTMRFAKTIKQIQGLQAYHSGDKLNVEVDIVLDEGMPLRDSHDLGESLQYVLESVPIVERAFVHMDYRPDNIPGHMEQQE